MYVLVMLRFSDSRKEFVAQIQHLDGERLNKLRGLLRWSPVVVLAVAILAMAGLLVRHSQTSSVDNMGPYQPVAGPSAEVVTKAPSEVKKMPKIAPSPAVQVFIPNREKDLVISSRVYPLNPCYPVIDPPVRGPLVGSIFGCSDYPQPGTTTKDLTILTGHSSVRLDAALNRLNKMGRSALGKSIWVRTRRSGDRWLIYKISHLYRPSKPELPNMYQIWGKPGVPLPGRLVLVTCFMKPDGSVADNNLVAVAQLQEVR